MNAKHIKIQSKKYAVEGEIIESETESKLVFEYDSKKSEIILSSDFTSLEKCESVTSTIIDDYVDKLCSNNERKPMLHKWYMEETVYGDNKEYTILRGTVSGHRYLMDSIFITTSSLKSYAIDNDNGELIAVTKNTVYHCPLSSCNFEKQDLVKKQILNYEKIKQYYQNKANAEKPTIDDGKVLLVISNHDAYYFNSLYYKPINAEQPIKYDAHPHTGMSQDSFLIFGKEVYLSYFPHYQNIEFYNERIGDKPFYIENIGDITIYCKTFCGIIKLNPKERKRVSKENAETKNTILSGRNLYPAEFL